MYGSVILILSHTNISLLKLQDYIGRCILTLTRAILEGEFQDTYVLQGAKSGKLNLHFKWTPQPIYRDRDQ